MSVYWTAWVHQATLATTYVTFCSLAACPFSSRYRNGYFVFKNGSFAEVNQEDPNSGLRGEP